MLAGPVVWGLHSEKSNRMRSPVFSTVTRMRTGLSRSIDAVVVDAGFSLVSAVGPGGDDLPQPALGMSRQFLGGGHHGGLAVFVQQFGHPPLTQPVGAHLPADVAHHDLRRPAVGMDQPFQFAHGPARVHELHRGQVQTLLKNLPGRARTAAGDTTADVALVGHAGAEAHPFALVEDGC